MAIHYLEDKLMTIQNLSGKLGAKGLAYIKINDVSDLENGIQSQY